MLQLFHNSFFDFVGKRYIAFGISFATFLLGVVGFIWHGGLNFNIDFTGGKLYELQFSQPITVDAVRSALSSAGLGSSDIQSSAGGKQVMIRMQSLKDINDEGTGANINDALKKAFPKASIEVPKAELDFAGYLTYHTKSTEPLTDEQLITALTPLAPRPGDLVITNLRENVEHRIQVRSERYGDLNRKMAAEFEKVSPGNSYIVLRDEVVGPKVGQELRKKAVYAVLWSLVGIMIYVAIRFRSLGGGRAGVAAVASLAHDVFLTLGVFAFLNLEFSLTVLAAILTLIGFSINDTIVVYDRIRENMRLSRKSYNDTINDAINQTLSRTVITVVTVLMVLICLYVMGGPVLRDFTFCMLFGVIIGTYSSIFVAAPILVEWEARSPKRLVKG